jgi:hypothetical protein
MKRTGHKGQTRRGQRRTPHALSTINLQLETLINNLKESVEVTTLDHIFEHMSREERLITLVRVCRDDPRITSRVVMQNQRIFKELSGRELMKWTSLHSLKLFKD